MGTNRTTIRCLARALALGLWASSAASGQAADGPIHVERGVRNMSAAPFGPFDPAREITFEMYEWIGETETTGHRMTFSIPMGHVYPLHVDPNAPVATFYLKHRWDAYLEDGTIAAAVRQVSEWPFGKGVTSPLVTVTVSSSLSLHRRRYEPVMIHARQFGAPWPGYESRPAHVREPGDLFHRPEADHCGLDAFETTEIRRWNWISGPDTSPPPPGIVPPFDRARVFGWPAEDGVTYRHIVSCETDITCEVIEPLNNVANVIYFIQPGMICEMPAFIPDHLEWLRGRMASRME